VGGGTGHVSSGFVDLTGHVVVCDINGSMLRQTKKRRGLIPLQADAKQLPFFPETFDRVLVVDALHHFPDPGFFVPQWLVRHSLKADLPAVLSALRTQVENSDSDRERAK